MDWLHSSKADMWGVSREVAWPSMAMALLGRPGLGIRLP